MPQPKTSLDVSAVWAQPVMHVFELQLAPVVVPVAQSLQPSEDCRLVKNSGGSLARVAPVQPLGAWVATSAAPMHTCHPAAQRSATLQPAPLGLGPSLPAVRPHAGSTVSMLQPPLQRVVDGVLGQSIDERIDRRVDRRIDERVLCRVPSPGVRLHDGSAQQRVGARAARDHDEGRGNEGPDRAPGRTCLHDPRSRIT